MALTQSPGRGGGDKEAYPILRGEELHDPGEWDDKNREAERRRL